MIFLDTNVIIAATNKRPKTTADRFDAECLSDSPLAVSSVVVLELRYGMAKSQRRQANGLIITQALKAVSIVPFDADDAAVAGTIRATLEATGTPICPYDLLIAAQALRHNATLVTANVHEFERVAGLKVVDWGR